MRNRIEEIELWKANLELTKPYRIAGETFDKAVNAFIRIRTASGVFGIGSASPMPIICGESMEDTMDALNRGADIIRHAHTADLIPLTKILGQELSSQPAAQAAIDMALYDLHCKTLNISVCNFLGRKLDSLETSVTIGITNPEEAQEELRSHLSAGFKVIKLKIGDQIEQDIAMVRKLREWGNSGFRLRVDGNEGYNKTQLEQFIRETEGCDIELIEQPLLVSQRHALKELPESIRQVLAADEDLITEQDAKVAAEESVYGIWNIKLMKSGGISPSKRIGELADAHDVRLMWGCNDESRVSIAAALHTAFSCSATRFLDLDGSFDIAKDIGSGGFVLREGKLRLTDLPGLGVTLVGD
jgi:L-alanine-DL-glutamate epimerase-like enolase superfamily enzyme